MKLYFPKVLFPALDLPLDAEIIVEVNEEIGKALVHRGWIVKDD